MKMNSFLSSVSFDVCLVSVSRFKTASLKSMKKGVSILTIASMFGWSPAAFGMDTPDDLETHKGTQTANKDDQAAGDLKNVESLQKANNRKAKYYLPLMSARASADADADLSGMVRNKILGLKILNLDCSDKYKIKAQAKLDDLEPFLSKLSKDQIRLFEAEILEELPTALRKYEREYELPAFSLDDTFPPLDLSGYAESELNRNKGAEKGTITTEQPVKSIAAKHKIPQTDEPKLEVKGTPSKKALSDDRDLVKRREELKSIIKKNEKSKKKTEIEETFNAYLELAKMSPDYSSASCACGGAFVLKVPANLKAELHLVLARKALDEKNHCGTKNQLKTVDGFKVSDKIKAQKQTLAGEMADIEGNESEARKCYEAILKLDVSEDEKITAAIKALELLDNLQVAPPKESEKYLMTHLENSPLKADDRSHISLAFGKKEFHQQNFTKAGQWFFHVYTEGIEQDQFVAARFLTQIERTYEHYINIRHLLGDLIKHPNVTDENRAFAHINLADLDLNGYGLPDGPNYVDAQLHTGTILMLDCLPALKENAAALVQMIVKQRKIQPTNPVTVDFPPLNLEHFAEPPYKKVSAPLSQPLETTIESEITKLDAEIRKRASEIAKLEPETPSTPSTHSLPPQEKEDDSCEELKKLTKSRDLPPPVYEKMKKEGKRHKCKVTVGKKYCTIGEGKTASAAEKNAAQKLRQLILNPTEKPEKPKKNENPTQTDSSRVSKQPDPKTDNTPSKETKVFDLISPEEEARLRNLNPEKKTKKKTANSLVPPLSSLVDQKPETKPELKSESTQPPIKKTLVPDNSTKNDKIVTKRPDSKPVPLTPAQERLLPQKTQTVIPPQEVKPRETEIALQPVLLTNSTQEHADQEHKREAQKVREKKPTRENKKSNEKSPLPAGGSPIRPFVIPSGNGTVGKTVAIVSVSTPVQKASSTSKQQKTNLTRNASQTAASLTKSEKKPTAESLVPPSSPPLQEETPREIETSPQPVLVTNLTPPQVKSENKTTNNKAREDKKDKGKTPLEDTPQITPPIPAMSGEKLPIAPRQVPPSTQQTNLTLNPTQPAVSLTKNVLPPAKTPASRAVEPQQPNRDNKAKSDKGKGEKDNRKDDPKDKSLTSKIASNIAKQVSSVQTSFKIDNLQTQTWKAKKSPESAVPAEPTQKPVSPPYIEERLTNPQVVPPHHTPKQQPISNRGAIMQPETIAIKTITEGPIFGPVMEAMEYMQELRDIAALRHQEKLRHQEELRHLEALRQQEMLRHHEDLALIHKYAHQLEKLKILRNYVYNREDYKKQELIPALRPFIPLHKYNPVTQTTEVKYLRSEPLSEDERPRYFLPERKEPTGYQPVGQPSLLSFSPFLTQEGEVKNTRMPEDQ